MSKNNVVPPRKRAKSRTDRDGYAQALERIAEEFAGRARTDGDHLAASVAIGLHQLIALWRGGSARVAITITTEATHAR
jgi:hypothetical protein